eukprot:2864939-Pleurochrysis_carterae.AAC.3
MKFDATSTFRLLPDARDIEIPESLPCWCIAKMRHHVQGVAHQTRSFERPGKILAQSPSLLRLSKPVFCAVGARRRRMLEIPTLSSGRAVSSS